jgi:dynein heavy chain
LTFEEKVNKNLVEHVRIHPKTFSAVQLFGWFSSDGYSKWHDGILTKNLRETPSKYQKWMICDGAVDYKWAENLESFMTSGVLSVYSGEQLAVSPKIKVILETDQLHNVSPGFISKCGIVLTEQNELPWTAFFDNWCRRTTDDANVMRWRRGQEELIVGLFQWLVPPLLNLVRFKCNSVIKPMPNSLARYMIEFFTSTLSEAIGNLKERKYLRSWIQAACVTSATWTIGGILAGKDRNLFDSKLRDILLGRSNEDPLPAILNNKFDALPPAEGLVYDFVFDFKARGQWKHWNDVVKNMENPEVLTALTIIPTIDTARLYHVYSLSLRCKKPLLVIGPPGIGKSMAIWSKIKSLADSTCYKFTALPSTTTQEFKTWLVEKLSKRKKATYGPAAAGPGEHGSAGTIFIDDLTSTHPDEFGQVAFHEQTIELIDSSTWYDVEAGCMKCKLEDINLVFATTLQSGTRSLLSDRILTRMNFTLMSHPSEESFVKIFSTTLSLTFKDQNYPPEVSGVIPSIIQSTYKVYSECRKVLLGNPQVYDRAHTPDLRDVQRIIRGCSALPKEAAENKKLFTRLWVHECLRNFFDRMKVDKDMDDVFQCMRTCVRTIFRENFDSAFEHLGKVDGQVTLLNLRNLLFGRYVMQEDKSNPFMEVTGFDQVEKVVQSKVKEHNLRTEREDIGIVPIRYSLELVSHIHRIISTEGGHGVIGGHGGDGRRTMAKIAALLNNHVFFNLPHGMSARPKAEQVYFQI